MRDMAIGFVLVVIAMIIYTIVARRGKKLQSAKKRFFDACERLDVTHPEGEQFLEFLDARHEGKRDIAFYDDAVKELHARVCTPRSISRDRRSIESIDPTS